MTPREKRERLFKKGRPNIRPLECYKDGKFHPDIATLWVAQQKQPFPFAGRDELDQSAFANGLCELAHQSEWVVADDNNLNFKRGRGIVAVAQVISDDWRVEPHVFFTPWATRKNILRTVVAYLQMVKLSRKVGVCNIVCTVESSGLFDKVTTYGVLRKIGVIPGGDPLGDQYLYSIRGRKNGWR